MQALLPYLLLYVTQGCLVMDPSGRMTCDELLEHSYFDHFRNWFQPELEMLLAKEAKKVAKSKSRMHVSTTPLSTPPTPLVSILPMCLFNISVVLCSPS